MLVPKKDRIAVYSYLLKEGVCVAKKDFFKEKHEEIDVPNLYVIKLMTSLKSRDLVRETFSWQHYYWYLTNEGIEYLREYLHLPPEVVPNTMKKPQSRPARPTGGMGREGRGDSRGPRFGDKKGGPGGSFNPEFRREGGFGRGGGQEGYRGGRPGGFGRGGN